MYNDVQEVDKTVRDENVDKIKEEVMEYLINELGEEEVEERKQEIGEILYKLEKKCVRKMILEEHFISLCAVFIASNIISSGISFAPASIIAILSTVPATVNVKSVFSLCSNVGFITICPSTYPTFTAAVGPPNGMSDIDSAADAPIIAATSKEPKEGIDFFPLSVDYEEKLYAAGKIPGSFTKREGKPADKAILT